MYKTYIKPIGDFVAAFIGLLLLSPIFIIVWLGLSIANNGKPFFFQRRPGKDERIFSIIKFKTMNDKKDEHGNLLPDAKRLTRIGKFVRKTSLDEIPQLINVVKGDMSLIGPRPLLPEYLPLYSEEQKKRHFVRPGITGWAQVNGFRGPKNESQMDKRFQYDLYYIKNWNLMLDFYIMIRTFFVILFQKVD